ncbi:hypothetical protein JOQ06_009507 [Pogonophryne albipinna]|uniref:Uncharacterized protein n=1 Tax=Pogonophryne albipinna TaxID=1090488 RepID=A0AAD6BSE1_9TELE|nr:hypothetical protein JOQ06_009507 [Pogonophryne albipinna]
MTGSVLRGVCVSAHVTDGPGGLLKATVQPPPHPLHHLSALAIHKALINFRPQVSLHHYTFIRSGSYQPAGPEYGNGIPATDKDGLDYPWLSFIR